MVCPGYWRWAPPEMAFAIEDFSPKVVVWQDEEIGGARLREARGRGWPAQAALWLQHDAGGEGSYEAVPCERRDPTDPEPGRRPGIRAAGHLHRCLSPAGSRLDAVAHQPDRDGRSVAWLGDIDDETVFLNSGPMFHIGNFQFFGIAGASCTAAPTWSIRRVDRRRACSGIARRGTLHPRLSHAGRRSHQIVELNQERGHELSALRGHHRPPAVAGPGRERTTSRYGREGGGLGSGYGQTEVTG